MAESALAKKMKLKEGYHATLINAPKGYADELKPLPSDVKLVQQFDIPSDWIQLFAKNIVELNQLFPKVLKIMKPTTLVWVCFPKGTSDIQTDLTRDKGWDVISAANLKWTNLVSVNDTWSAFSMRPYKKGEAKQNFR
jgi:hypothetical protein